MICVAKILNFDSLFVFVEVVIKIDKRKTLTDFKQLLEEHVGVSSDKFRVSCCFPFHGTGTFLVAFHLRLFSVPIFKPLPDQTFFLSGFLWLMVHLMPDVAAVSISRYTGCIQMNKNLKSRN